VREHGTQRFAALDGLRAVAALGVLLYHVAGWTGRPGGFAHGYLAVDFFFCLSGFVLAHAFERRQIGWPAYLWIRIVRIWPLLVLSTLIGAVLTSRHSPPFWPNLARGLLLIPRMGHPVDWTFPTLFPFNPLAWSLCLEVIVSALWFPLRRLPDLGLMAIVLLSGAMMVYVAWTLNGIETGWDQATFWWGVARASLQLQPGLGLLALSGPGAQAAPGAAGPRADGGDGHARPALERPLRPGLRGGAVPAAGAGRRPRPQGRGGRPVPDHGRPLLPALRHALGDLGGDAAALSGGLEAAPARPGSASLGVIVALAVAWVAFRFYDAPVRRWLRKL
jgi:peptidoglycan/LPS O-acetylase OafA/YrhL